MTTLIQKINQAKKKILPIALAGSLLLPNYSKAKVAPSEEFTEKKLLNMYV